MATPNVHIPVLLDPIVESLEQVSSSEPLKIFDGTLGGGGYTKRFLDNGWHTYSSDLDEAAIVNFQKVNTGLVGSPVMHLKKSNFASYIQEFSDSFFDGITLDLGFSSNQLEAGQRGFSYLRTEEVFDLRYDTDLGEPVWQKILYLKSAFDLQKVIYTYSGEQLSKRLAESLYSFAKQKNGPFTVQEAISELEKVIPVKMLHKKNGIYSRVWQALRIWTNEEFKSLTEFLDIAPFKLKTGGRLAIVCFHSLEDKIVTKRMRELARPVEVDDFGNKRQNFGMLTPKAITPSEEEITKNVRSRSATLRVLQRL